jgi:alkylated DNA repair dioxygenase AlkB
MSQPTLFDLREERLGPDRTLIDDERGRITYTPVFVDAVTTQAWFDALRRDVQWRTERRMMYEREVDVPRLMAHFRLDPPPESAPEAIVAAARLVVDRLRVSFNSVGLNFYRDGRDSVAPHNDHLNELRKGFPIALISLGSVRRMTIRAKATPRHVIQVDLDPGSLLVMDYATQLHYTHAVPKTSQPVGERISLAFRVKRPLPASADGTERGVYR